MLSMLWKAGLDASAFFRGMAKVKEKGEKTFDGIADSLTKKLGKAAVVYLIYDAFKRLYYAIKENVQTIKDLSDNMGLTTDEVQRLGIAADKSAVQMSTVEGALRRIDDLRTSAQSGDKSAMSLFSTLGIDPSQGTSLEILRKAVDQSAKGAKQQAAFFDLVGTKANQIKSVVVELGKLGPIKLVEESDIKMIDDLSTSLKELSREALTVATEKAAPFFGMVSRIIKRGRELDAQGKMFSLSRAIIEESYVSGPVSGVDGSALPLPLKKPKTDPSSLASIPLALQSDALSRIGLFVGGRGDSGNQLVTIGNYQLSELRAIRAELQHANR